MRLNPIIFSIRPESPAIVSNQLRSYAPHLRVLTQLILTLALSGCCLAQTNGSFSVSAALWPTPDFPVGNPKEIILAGQIRNVSQKDTVWRGMPKQSGYGEVRVAGTQSPVCEALPTDERPGSWEHSFPVGTSTPYRYDFRAISCDILSKDRDVLEARFCVNPHMFSPLPEGTCSTWVRVEIDAGTAALRRDDDVFRAQMGTFEHTGDEALQKRLLGALQLRALRSEPPANEEKVHAVGMPNEALATLWLEFIRTEVAVMAQKPQAMPTTRVIPPDGCWQRPDPHFWCALRSSEEVQKNDKLIAQVNHFSELHLTAMNSVADFGMCMGQEYRRNPEARKKLYAQATAMGLPEQQVSELRRFLEFATSSE
jgi:hypothetical protein